MMSSPFDTKKYPTKRFYRFDWYSFLKTAKTPKIGLVQTLRAEFSKKRIRLIQGLNFI